jgi:hypothetical protein
MASATTRFTVNRLQPAQPSPLATLGVAKLLPLANLSAGTVLGAITEGSPTAAVHTLTFGGTLTGGTFRLVFGNDTLLPVAYNATAATQVANLQVALDGYFGPGNTAAAGTGPFTVTFQNGMTNLAVPAPSVLASLTGTSPTLTASVTTAGVAAGTVFAAYAAGNSDGTQVARRILAEDTVTDARARRITNIAPGHEAADSATIYDAGPFYCSDLIGLDAGAVTSLGVIHNATAFTVSTAIITLK